MKYKIKLLFCMILMSGLITTNNTTCQWLDKLFNSPKLSPKISRYEKINNRLFIGSNVLVRLICLSRTLTTHKYLKNNKYFIDAPYKTVKQVRDIANKFNIKNAKTIQVKNPNSFISYISQSLACAYGRTVVINRDKLDNLSREMGLSFQEKRQLERFILGHELTHIKNKDYYLGHLLHIISPLIAHFGLKGLNTGLSKIANYWFQNNPAISSTLKMWKKISNFFMIKNLIAMSFENFIMRQQEYRADRGSAEGLGIEATRSGIRSFTFLDKKINKNIPSKILQRFIDPEHPSFRNRVKQLRKIEKKQLSTTGNGNE